VPRLRDHERRARADDARRLAQDHLDPSRVGVRCELARALRWLDVVEPDEAAFDLRDRLLRDDDDVAVLERRSVGDQRAEVVALAQLGQALDRQDRDHSPVMLTPAWPL
jgi:hypothetical protein